MKEDVFRIESNVRSYCRSFPVIFNKAKGSILYSESGQEYLDFLSGAGALNYGHNNKNLKNLLIDYIEKDTITHGLDFYTSIKREFLLSLNKNILIPRKLDYKVQFCGSTGTNAVEAAIKLARKVTGRTEIFSFMGGFHGMTLGSLALTGDKYHRAAAGIPLNNVTFIPYPEYIKGLDSINYINTILDDPNSGIEIPAAIIIETVQAEGGVNIAKKKWLQDLKLLCERFDIQLICDEIQTGCGRTGPFFSFEHAEIIPDIVLLAKSISGYGLPCSLILYKKHLDIWKPAEHNGTFRGNQLAFVTGQMMFEHYWSNNALSNQITSKEKFLCHFMKEEIQTINPSIHTRGIGLIWGIDLSEINKPELIDNFINLCFKSGLLIESCGRNRRVIKLLPALTISQPLLIKGCKIIKQVLSELIS